MRAGTYLKKTSTELALTYLYLKGSLVFSGCSVSGHRFHNTRCLDCAPRYVFFFFFAGFAFSVKAQSKDSYGDAYRYFVN